MKNHFISYSLTAAAMLLAAVPAQASLILSLNPVTARAGDIGDYFDVTLANTGSAVPISAFAFGLSVADSNITFTSATMDTAQPYIFAGDSFVLLALGLTNIDTTSGGGTLIASDLTNSAADVTLASGSTVGLGRVFFDVGLTPNSHIEVTLTAYPTTSLSDSLGTNIPIDTLSHGAIDITSTAVPEPATLFTTGLAVPLLLAGSAIARRLRRRSGSRTPAV